MEQSEAIFWWAQCNEVINYMACVCEFRVSHMALVVKNLSANSGNKRDVGSNPGWERSPGRVNGNPLQYSCLENPRNRGAWYSPKSQTHLRWSCFSYVQLFVTLWTIALTNSSVPGILQTRILEWISIPTSFGVSSQPRNPAHLSDTSGRFFTAEGHTGSPNYMAQIIIVNS